MVPMAGIGPALGSFPQVRPRRLRRTAAIRRLVADVAIDPSDLVLPLFYRQGLAQPNPIESLPGVVQHSLDSLVAAAGQVAALGLGGLMLFAVPAQRDDSGSGAIDPDGALNQAVRAVNAEVGDATVVMADLCLDEFTSHGHCGILGSAGVVDNDATLLRYRDMAVALGEAGAQFVGTSGMMDGQVAAVRDALDLAGFVDVGILAYAGKAASALYGPFREAVDSRLSGDRRSYQQDPAASRDAVRDVWLDIAEGADIVMVKPASMYLDVLREVAEISPVPVAAYQVSGEYAMVEAAAQRGWVDREALIGESLSCMKRAGASIVLSYWAAEYATRKAGSR